MSVHPFMRFDRYGDFQERMEKFRTFQFDPDKFDGHDPLRMALVLLMLVAPDADDALSVAVRASNLSIYDGGGMFPSGTKFAVALAYGLRVGPNLLREVAVDSAGGEAWLHINGKTAFRFVDELMPKEETSFSWKFVIDADFIGVIHRGLSQPVAA